MTDYLLNEDSSFLLLEDGAKIILQVGVSPSPSISASVSPSASTSPSPSESPSVSAGYSDYSRGTLSPSARYKYGGVAGIRYTYGQHIRYGGTKGLAVDDSDLDTIYTEQEEVKVSAIDTDWVGQEGALVYMLHQFKSFVGDHAFCTLEWVGKSTLPPSLSAVYFQVYNKSTGLWENFDSNSTSNEDLDFELEARIPDTTNYKGANSTISCRVYQLAI